MASGLAKLPGDRPDTPECDEASRQGGGVVGLERELAGATGEVERLLEPMPEKQRRRRVEERRSSCGRVGGALGGSEHRLEGGGARVPLVEQRQRLSPTLVERDQARRRKRAGIGRNRRERPVEEAQRLGRGERRQRLVP